MAVPYTNMLDYMILIFPVLLLGTGIAFAMSVVIAVRFTNTITTPLNEISREMEKVRSDNPSFTFKTYKDKELNVMSATTMKMAEEIREHMDRLEKEKRIRQEFFSNASHELKTPITSVRGYAELLDQGFVTDEAVKKDFIARILKETDNMTNLINDILMISRLEAKEAEVTYSTVRMVPLLTEIFESVEPLSLIHIWAISTPWHSNMIRNKTRTVKSYPSVSIPLSRFRAALARSSRVKQIQVDGTRTVRKFFIHLLLSAFPSEVRYNFA